MEKKYTSCVLNTDAQTHIAKSGSDFTSHINRRSRIHQGSNGSPDHHDSLSHSATATLAAADTGVAGSVNNTDTG